MSEAATRILVAEDEFLIRLLMVETLEEAGFEVLEAADGEEACRLIEDPDHIDLIVTDLHMPRIDGIGVARHGREIRPTVPILFVSARSDLLAGLAAPVPHRLLSKPFTMDELKVIVRQLLM